MHKGAVLVVSRSKVECSMSMRMPSNPAVFAIIGSSTVRTSFTESVYATSSRCIFSRIVFWSVSSVMVAVQVWFVDWRC